MIVPQSASPAVSSTKEANSTILSSISQPATPATKAGDVVVVRGKTSSGQYATVTKGGMVKVDKNTLLDSIARTEAFNQAFSDIPPENRIWEDRPGQSVLGS